MQAWRLRLICQSTPPLAAPGSLTTPLIPPHPPLMPTGVAPAPHLPVHPAARCTRFSHHAAHPPHPTPPPSCPQVWRLRLICQSTPPLAAPGSLTTPLIPPTPTPHAHRCGACASSASPPRRSLHPVLSPRRSSPPPPPCPQVWRLRFICQSTLAPGYTMADHARHLPEHHAFLAGELQHECWLEDFPLLPRRTCTAVGGALKGAACRATCACLSLYFNEAPRHPCALPSAPSLPTPPCLQTCKPAECCSSWDPS